MKTWIFFRFHNKSKRKLCVRAKFVERPHLIQQTWINSRILLISSWCTFKRCENVMEWKNASICYSWVFFSIFTGWRFAHQGEPIATEGRTCHFTFLSTLTFQFCIRVDCLYTNWTAYELIYVLLHCKAYYWIISMFFFLYLYLFLLNALNPLRSN